MCFLKLNLLVAYLPKSEQCQGFFYGSPCKVFNVGEYLLRSPPDDFRMWKRWETVGNRLERSNSFTWICFFFFGDFSTDSTTIFGRICVDFCFKHFKAHQKSQQHEKSESIFNPQMETILDFFIGANTCIY